MTDLTDGAPPRAEPAAGLTADARALKELLEADGHRVPGSLRLERIEAGLSNETYLVNGFIQPRSRGLPAGDRWVFRRPPHEHRLPSAHDMEREFETLQFLAGPGYPAPKPLFLTRPDSPLGSAYVMSWEPGRTLASARDSGQLTPAQRARASYAFINALAWLHDLDVTGYPRRSRATAPFAARQLSVWRRQWRASDPAPELARSFDGVAAKLAPWAESRPTARVAVVHGDYRIDNTILDDHFQVRAVVDWEMATVGDPLCDLGLLLVYWSEAGDGERARTGVAEGVTQAAGFPTRDELIAHYARISAIPPEDMDRYTALGYLKLAAIFQGIHARMQIRAQRSDRFATVTDAIPRLLALAEQC